MAEIHPNDIGLATYDEVGDVAKLRTTAKTIVTAINELYQNGGSIQNIMGKQMYVDGSDNVIIGENNVVYGNNNLIIGSDNCIVGSNLAIITDNISKSKTLDFELYFPYFDTSNNILYYYYYFYDEEPTDFSLPFKVGDKIVINLCKMWANDNWDDYVSVYSGLTIGEITEIDESSECMKISGVEISSEPPDNNHTVEDYTYLHTCIPLNEHYLLDNTDGGLCLGGAAFGTNSISVNSGNAKGGYSFAANSASASGSYSSAFGYSTASKHNAFSANYAKSEAEYGAAFNYAYAYTPYSFAMGYYAKTYGRPLKCTGINRTAKTLTIDPTYSLSGITSSHKIILRCFNTNNTIIYAELNISSVSGNTIYLDSEAYLGSSGNYAYQLFPDGIIFVVDTSTSYANASCAGGYYSIASGKYTNANGYYTIAGAEGSNIWGKYGMTTEPYSLALANGTGHKTPGLAFKVLSDGSVHADAEYTSPCADYAEYFEWADGNLNAEDRVGYFVKLDGEKIVKCSEFDKPLGIISAMPAIIGDSGEMHWKGKYVTDDFGRIQYHDVVVPAEYDEEMNLISEEHIERQPILNPAWDSSEEYIPRKDRPEWSPVGVLGKLVVYDDGTLQSGDICRPGPNGIAVKSIENGYPVLKRVSEDKVLVWFKE